MGILSVVFGDYGWIPNKNIYAISQFVYQIVIPILIAYTAGNQRKQFGKNENLNRLYAGGVIAVMATSGMLLADTGCSILFAMLFGPLCGILWERIIEPIVERGKSGLEMLIRNITVALAGSIMAIFAFYIIAPCLSAGTGILFNGMNFLIEQHLIFLLSFIIEPAKILFLNNSINHGILLPLGMQQAEQTGESILFLLETNPGPGFGVLAALSLCKKEKRKEYLSSMFVELIGGVHEIYFPEILSNIWLLLALVGGGAAGNFCFSVFHAAAAGVISPGSVMIVFLLSTKHRIIGVLLGILASAAVSAALAVLILRLQNRVRKKENKKIEEKKQPKQEEKMEANMVWKVGVVCNAGLGSSAIGAALFRRKLKEMEVAEIEVSAYAADQIPEDVTIVVCQKDFKEWIPQKEKTIIYTVENLLNQAEYLDILNKIQKRGKENESNTTLKTDFNDYVGRR